MKIEKDLVGHWIFVKTLDSENNEVKYTTAGYDGLDGKEIKIIANGPEIIINNDHTYIKKFTPEDSDKGHWKLISNDEVEYEMIVSKESSQGYMITRTQKFFKKKWRTDASGNYLDSSIDKIILLTENEMRVVYEKKYIQVFRKI